MDVYLLLGLYYYRARYYDAGLRRFLQADPIGYDGGMNLYAYVGNSPLSLVDPRGLDAFSRRDEWLSGAYDRLGDLNAVQRFTMDLVLLQDSGVDVDSLSDCELDALYFDAERHVNAMTFGLMSIYGRSLVVRIIVKVGELLNHKPKSVGAAANNERFPSVKKLVKMLETDTNTFHRTIKRQIVNDVRSYANKINTTNPDIGIMDSGHVVLRNPETRKTIVTDVLLEWYKP